jgi:hypothetical protein
MGKVPLESHHFLSWKKAAEVLLQVGICGFTLCTPGVPFQVCQLSIENCHLYSNSLCVSVRIFALVLALQQKPTAYDYVVMAHTHWYSKFELLCCCTDGCHVLASVILLCKSLYSQFVGMPFMYKQLEFAKMLWAQSNGQSKVMRTCGCRWHAH